MRPFPAVAPATLSIRGFLRPIALFQVVAGALALAPAHAQGTVTLPPGSNIQAAIAAGNTNVFLQAGVYNGDIVLPPPPNEVTITGTAGTILVGTGTGSVITIAQNQTAATVVQRLAIKGGNAARGGGIFVRRARPTLRNLTITGNGAGLGGGLFIDATPALGSSGGGGGPAMRVSRCSFLTNTAGEGGGAYVVRPGLLPPGTDVLFTNCVFETNLASSLGGGLAVTGATRVRVERSRFAMNGATIDAGGGIAIYRRIDGEMAEHPAFELDLADVRDNTAGQFGGGLHANQAIAVLVGNTTLQRNSATSRGGQIHFDDGTWDMAPTYRVKNCLLVEGKAILGGGIATWSADSAIESCTFHGNNGYSSGGAVWAGGSVMSITSSILWGDLSSAVGSEEVGQSQAVVLIGDSDVAGGFAGLGNIVANPVWVTGHTCTWTPNGGYFLDQANSLCVDPVSALMLPPAFPLGWLTDAAGLQDTQPIDMGFHYPPPTCP